LPDMEAIEVAQAALADESESETSEALRGENLEQPVTDTEEAADADDADDAAGEDSETESKSQRRRRLRREKEQEVARKVSALEAENARLKERQKSRGDRPDPDYYTSESEYAADLAVWKSRAADVQAETENLRTRYDEVDGEDAGAFQAATADLNAEGAEKYKDYNEVVTRPRDQGGPAITVVMAEALLESDMGADIAYYLGKNVKESEKISAMSPVAQAKAIWKLEAKVGKSNAPAQSQAPAPVKPVRGGSSAPTKPVSEMSMSEYAAYRQKQMNG
jgi:hypothetical protein